MKPGHIYLLRNPSYQANYHKLGKTTDTVEKRSKQLSRPTGVPSDFITVYQHSVIDCDKAENMAKERLKKYRVDNTEFFDLPQNEAIKVLMEVVNAINLIEKDDEPNPFADCVVDNICELFESGQVRLMDGEAFKLQIYYLLSPIYERLTFTSKEFANTTGISENRVGELASQLKFETEEQMMHRLKLEEDRCSQEFDQINKRQSKI
jgi:T5orf172 domain-containing protein